MVVLHLRDFHRTLEEKMKTDTLGTTIKTDSSTIGEMRLEYRLCRSRKRICGRYSYSIYLNEENDGETGTVYAADVSRTRQRAVELFNLISKGQVTSCTFYEVLSEIL